MNTDNLIELREELKLKQYQMAELVGVHSSTYTRYENGTKKIPLKRLNIIANKYNLSLDFLAGVMREKKTNSNHVEIDKKLIGRRLKETRIAQNLTQEQLAKKLNTVHSSISEYESGKRITVSLLIEYRKITNKSIDWFCGKENN